MRAIWSFEDGHLTAKDDSGRVVTSRAAERIMGLCLADLLNVNTSLSDLLLWPWHRQGKDLASAKPQTGP